MTVNSAVLLTAFFAPGIPIISAAFSHAIFDGFMPLIFTADWHT